MTHATMRPIAIIRLYDYADRYLGSIFEHPEGFTHSIQRIEEKPLADFHSAKRDFAETKDRLPESTHRLIFGNNFRNNPPYRVDSAAR